MNGTGTITVFYHDGTSEEYQKVHADERDETAVIIRQGAGYAKKVTVIPLASIRKVTGEWPTSSGESTKEKVR
jgi:hypothetical protein